MSSEAGPWCCREGRDVYFRENVTPHPHGLTGTFGGVELGLDMNTSQGRSSVLWKPSSFPWFHKEVGVSPPSPALTSCQAWSQEGERGNAGPPARPGRGRLAGRPGAGAPASCSVCRPAGGVWLFLGVSGASRETEAARRPTRSPAWHLRPSPGRVRQRSWPRAVRHGHRGTVHASVPSPA